MVQTDHDPMPFVAKSYRLKYIDGLKFLAALVLFNFNFFEFVIPVSDETFNIDHPGYFLRNSSWAISLFFILSGRSLTLSFWKHHKTEFGNKIEQINWFIFAGSYFTRLFRFILPAVFVSILQWKLCEHGYLDVANEARNTVLAGSLMLKPGWCKIENSQNWWLTVVNLFTWDNVVAIKEVSGMLWLTPWALWASYFTFFTFAIFSVLPSNRVLLYIPLLFFSWITFGYHYAALLGLVIADLNVSGVFRWIEKRAPRVLFGLQVLFGGLGLFVTLYRPAANAIDQASAIQRSDMTQIRMSDTMSVSMLLLVAETSGPIQRVLSFPVFSMLGRLSLGISVLHLSYLFSIVPSMAIAYGGELSSSFFAKTYFALLAVTLTTAIGFYIFIEKPSVIIGKWIWRFFTSTKSPIEEVKMIPSLVIQGLKDQTNILLRRTPDATLISADDEFGDHSFDTERIEVVEEKLEKHKDDTLAVLSAIAYTDPDKITSEKPLPSSPIASPPTTSPSVQRRGYLDGIRGVAMLMIWTYSFAQYTWTKEHPDELQYETFQYILRHGQLALSLFFILTGRVLLLNFYQQRHNDDRSKWMIVSSANFRRLFRLGLPALVVGFIQWQFCINNSIDTAAAEAEQYLKSGVLAKPSWCDLGDFLGYLTFIVDIFSVHDFATLLAKGGTLWCLYVIFWGSAYTYAVGMIVSFIPRRRYLLYSFLLVWLYYVQSPNAFFIFGLLICDLDTAGLLKTARKFKWWKVLIYEMILIVAAFVIITYSDVSRALDNFATGKSIVNGAYSASSPSQFEYSRYPSWWIPALCLMTYIELSPVTQWILSSWVLRSFAKASLGFFLLHMSVIYVLMPHLILHFSASYNFWNTIILTYTVSTISLFVFSYISHVTVEAWSIKMGSALWNYLFVDGDVKISQFPAKFRQTLISFVHEAPLFIPHWYKRKYAAFKKITGRPDGNPDRPARDLELEKLENVDPATLHSTYWFADLSTDPVARRTASLLRLNSFMAPFHFLGMLGLFTTWFLLNPVGPWTEEQVFNFSSLWKIIWLFSLPHVLLTFIGYSTPRIARKKEDVDKRPVLRDLIRNFYIVIVTKGSNPEAVRRGYTSMLPLEQLHPSVKVVVLTDEPYSYPDLYNIVCPKDYKSDKGIAKYKARALDYFRKHVQLTSHDWILHMDEESTIDAESLRRCFDFIRYEKHHFGQGVILYNAYSYWSNWLFTVADAVRVGDDLARFNLQYTVFQRPVFGAHGSFLMTNGHLENLVTWDFGTLAEDFEFSHKAWELGFTCGAIHGIVREQSPVSVRDFLKQRRRWYLGIRDIQGQYYLPQLAVKLWSTGIFCLIATIINIPLSLLIDGSATPIWIAVLSSFCFAVFYWLYLFGLIFQDLDYGTPWYLMIIRFFLGIILQPFCSILEGAAVAWAMGSEGVVKFEVIKK